MSLLKLAAVQIGKSATASQNFHWRNLLDGLLRLSRGNAEDASPTDVMRVNANNSVEFPGNVASGVLGAGQPWQDVTGSRAIGVTYTNTTGKPLVVDVYAVCSTAAYLIATVGGVPVRGPMAATGQGMFLSVIIPTGATYMLTASAGTTSGLDWKEMR